VDIRNFHDTYANQTGIRRFISTSGNAPRA